jgi:hypothetical protein
MGSILPFIAINAFDPEMTHAMSSAMQSAWEQLAASGRVETMPFRADVTRERMASAIINEARQGVTDPGRLTAAALGVILAESRMRAAMIAREPERPSV